MTQTEVSLDPADARYIDDDAGFAALLDELRGADRYGFDTEFHRERTYFARLALLQISWVDGLAIIDPLKVDIAPLAEIFSGPGLAVVHACDQDLEILERATGRLPTRIFDTQVAAGFLGMSTPSLGALADRILGLQLEKGDQLTDWTRRPLSAEQRRYAASDVAHLLQLESKIRTRLDALGRTAWAEGEFERIVQAARRPTLPEEAWWKLRQARQLRGSQRGVAQSVSAWRERRAQSLDVPVRTVLSDLALASIAHRPPRTRVQLDEVRGIDRRSLAKEAGNEILAAVEEGRALPPSAIHVPPVIPEAPSQRSAIALALAYVAERAHELDLDPTVLATRADVAGFVKSPPEGRLVSSWRRELVGEPIRRLVSGQAALAIVEGNLVMEERSGVRIVADEVTIPTAPSEP